MSKSERQKTIRVHVEKETTLESLINDTITFGGIGFLYWLNHNYLGDTTVGYLTAFVMVLLFILSKAAKVGMFEDMKSGNPDEAIAFIRSHFPEEKGE